MRIFLQGNFFGIRGPRYVYRRREPRLQHNSAWAQAVNRVEDDEENEKFSSCGAAKLLSHLTGERISNSTPLFPCVDHYDPSDERKPQCEACEIKGFARKYGTELTFVYQNKFKTGSSWFQGLPVF